MAEPKQGHIGHRPYPPTSREAEHDPKCLHDAPGPGGHVCDLGCEEYIGWVESFWDGFDEAAQRVIDLWNRDNRGGWIPGGAYQDLARILEVDVQRLSHYDVETKTRHVPA